MTKDSRGTVECALGIDIGGTKIAAGIIDLHGRVLMSEARPTQPEAGRTAVIERVLEMAHRLVSHAQQPLAVGIGTAGQVDPTSGVILDATQRLPPDWIGTSLSEPVQQVLGLPVAVVNDVHAMALGESHFGAAYGAQNALCIAVGTGVGGALILEGQLYTGANGAAGLFGHTLFRHRGRRCSCGRLGHLEAYVSGPSIVRRYRLLAGDSGASDAFAAAKRGEAAAERAVVEAADCLGEAVASLVNAFDPEMVVVGGGIIDAGPAFSDRLRHVLNLQTMPAARRRLRLMPAKLGTQAAIVGAAVAGLRAVGRKPIPREVASTEHARQTSGGQPIDAKKEP